MRGTTGQLLFSLRNFRLYLNHMLDLGMDMFILAKTMAECLAVMHWAAKTDARGVEFVLGDSEQRVATQDADKLAAMGANSAIGTQSYGPEAAHQRRTRLWLLDFSQVQTITMDAKGVAQAVKAFYSSDPYYPQPVAVDQWTEELWNYFAWNYLAMSDEILGKEEARYQELPLLFVRGIKAWQEMENKTTENMFARASC